MDDDYLSFVLKLQSQGFELALHGVGDGTFTSREIMDGIGYIDRKSASTLAFTPITRRT